jgi:hypothetical protein
MAVRSVVEPLHDRWAILLGPAWRRDCDIAPGDQVDVVIGSTVQRVERTFVLLASTRSWHCCPLASSSDRTDVASLCTPPGEHRVRGGHR